MQPWFAANVDGMGNCLFLRTAKHLTTPNDFSTLRALPAPGALVLVYGHLDEAAVRTDVRAIYQARNASAPAAELDPEYAPLRSDARAVLLDARS